MKDPSHAELTGGPFGWWDRPNRSLPLPDDLSWERVADLLRKVAGAERPEDREYALEKIRWHLDHLVALHMANIDEEHASLFR